MSEQLTEEQLAEYTEAFTLFDWDSDGLISTAKLGVVVRSLNRNPTEAQLTEIISQIDSTGRGAVNLSEFLRLMSHQMNPPYSEEEVLEAFKVFDKQQNGRIEAPALRVVLTSLGEKLTDEEMEAMINEAVVDGGDVIEYEDFVKKMMALK